ncbi:MAG: polysulfide reductase NrfD [Deltaproteobacteria bacterium]|nr:polysulfide reductase NrfD [Deltaproteobacteria bacterium]
MTWRDEAWADLQAARPGTGYRPWALAALVLAVFGGTAFGIGVTGTQAARAWQVFLINYLFWSGLAFGSILISAVLVITQARWGRPIKRLAEAPAAFLPFSLLLFWVLYGGRDQLFPWLRDPAPHQAAWLKAPFLFARDGLALFLLTAVSLALVYYSVRGEREIQARGMESWAGSREQGAANLHKQAVLAPLLAILYPLVFSLIGFDLVMSLSPEWHSTLFGMYFFTGGFYSALAGLMILAVVAVKPLRLGRFIRSGQFHDLGKLLLGFSLVTGDFFFSQFLVIWYGNLPEETRYVITRVNSAPWQGLAWTVLALCFVLPFIVLLSRKAKQRPGFMLLLSGIILIGMWLERFLLVAPSLWKGKDLPLGLLEILISLGFLGLMGLSLLWFGGRFPLLPLSDPLFQDLLQGEEERARG